MKTRIESGLRYGGFVIWWDGTEFVAEEEKVAPGEDRVCELGSQSVDRLIYAIDELWHALHGIGEVPMPSWYEAWVVADRPARIALDAATTAASKTSTWWSTPQRLPDDGPEREALEAEMYGQPPAESAAPGIDGDKIKIPTDVSKILEKATIASGVVTGRMDGAIDSSKIVPSQVLSAAIDSENFPFKRISISPVVTGSASLMEVCAALQKWSESIGAARIVSRIDTDITIESISYG